VCFPFGKRVSPLEDAGSDSQVLPSLLANPASSLVMSLFSPLQEDGRQRGGPSESFAGGEKDRGGEKDTRTLDKTRV